MSRLRFFLQLEEELQSHQHEEQWLKEKGQQLAQRDAELAGEVRREVSLLESTWEETQKLITERYRHPDVRTLIKAFKTRHTLTGLVMY